MAMLIILAGFPWAFNRAFNSVHEGLQYLAVRLHRYNSCLIRPAPIFEILPRPLIEVPDSNVDGLTPT